MRILVNKSVTVFLLTACLSLAVNAQDLAQPGQDYVLPDLFQQQTYEWQHQDMSITDSGYEAPNQVSEHLLQGAVQNYLESRLSTLGIPRPAVTLTGAALIFAVGQDAMFNLNESKTMSLQFKDIRDNERAILYRLKYSW